ncbi:hypothetical protein FQN54_008657 [Arachnomyces sp. PD_36]|nr:hypothetical protein FQN54_008657 [Arachnomyces sp. PD_36]
MNGTEPPAKRTKRTDSSAMWDMNEKPPRPAGRESKEADRSQRRDLPTREESKQTTSTRDDRRHRSRSREDTGRRRDRSRSRDRARDGGRDRDSRRDRDRDRDGRGGRGRDRSLSRERHRSRRDHPPSKPDRHHDRSRSPTRNERERKSRTRSPPPRGGRSSRKEPTKDRRPRDDEKATNGEANSKQHTSRPKPQSNDEMDVDAEDDDSIEAEMRKAMGFSSFRSTQNTKVPGNQIYGARKEKKTQYRQYMNRTGGFNRPLSPTRR